MVGVEKKIFTQVQAVKPVFPSCFVEFVHADCLAMKLYNWDSSPYCARVGPFQLVR